MVINFSIQVDIYFLIRHGCTQCILNISYLLNKMQWISFFVKSSHKILMLHFRFDFLSTKFKFNENYNFCRLKMLIRFCQFERCTFVNWSLLIRTTYESICNEKGDFFSSMYSIYGCKWKLIDIFSSMNVSCIF